MTPDPINTCSSNATSDWGGYCAELDRLLQSGRARRKTNVGFVIGAREHRLCGRNVTEGGVRRAPAPTTKQPIPFAAGQWTRYTVTRPNEAPSKLEYKVISTQGDAHWFEVEVGKAGKISVIQFLLVAKDRTDTGSFELREAKIRLPSGHVQVLKGLQLRATRKLIDQYLTSLRIPAFGSGPQQDAKVPAGTFKQCYVNEVDGTFFGIKTKSKTWNHPVVPISTMVRSIERTDGAEIVLEAFGLTGAKSALGS